ncbi:MAG: hypothetical protein NT159_01435, partial [Proteobacteria bacterium]|nr:hypothetical protein [Pseudomonadota bacterium]
FTNGDAVTVTVERTGDNGVDSLPTAAADGPVDAVTATFTPALTLVDQQKCCVVLAGPSTSATPSFTPNGWTTYLVKGPGAAALVAGEMNGTAIFIYHSAGTYWELMNPVAVAAAGGSAAASLYLFRNFL